MQRIKVELVKTDSLFETPRDAELYVLAFHPEVTRTLSVSEPEPQTSPSTLWMNEAILYLGLDRTGIRRPDKAIHRLIAKGSLHPKKVSGRLLFSRDELDAVLANGDGKRGRGRPRKT